jgi:branched-subunit amino acid ABC-type transport system permease component
LPQDFLPVLMGILIGGLTRGALYALIASGLTLVFGLTRIMNFAHGAFVMVGTYLSLTILQTLGDFTFALIIAPAVLAVLGLAVERVLLRPTYRAHGVNQFLLTYGLSLIISQLTLIIWGPVIHVIRIPVPLDGTFDVFGATFEVYSLFIVAVSITVLAVLYAFLRLSNFGLIVRAAIHSRDMISSLGVNIDLVYVILFTAGSAIAGLAGVLTGPLFSASLGLGQNIIIVAFVVVIVGGLGSLKGSLVGALIVGLSEVSSIFLIPVLHPYVIYIVLLIVLVVRPQGLFGWKE